MRVLGLLLVGMGTVLAILTALALAGIMPLQIEFFGMSLETRRERFALLCGLLIAALVGLVLLRVSRKPRQPG